MALTDAQREASRAFSKKEAAAAPRLTTDQLERLRILLRPQGPQPPPPRP